MRSVLVGIDDSDYSRAAVDLGLKWAREQNLMLVGLGIVDLKDLAPSEAVPLGASAFKVHLEVQNPRGNAEYWPWSWTSSAAMGSPKPVPPFWAEPWKGVNRFAFARSGRPGPPPKPPPLRSAVPRR